MRENNDPPINIWSNDSDQIGISLIAISAFTMSRCTCTRNPRFSDSWCAPFPSFSPFWLHNGPCDQSLCDLGLITSSEFRHLRWHNVYVHGIHDFPIRDALQPSWLSPGPRDRYPWPFVGISGFIMIMFIRPLDLRYVDPRLPLYSLHLSSTDSWGGPHVICFIGKSRIVISRYLMF